MNAWAAAWPSFGRRLVTWSSYIVLTEPIPDRLAEIGWTGGEGLADARFTLHYLRTTRDGRIAIGAGAAGPASAGASDRSSPMTRPRPRGRPPACAASSRACARCASRTRGAARSTSPPTISRASGPCPDGRSTSPTGTRGNGVAPSVVAGGRWPGWPSARRRSGWRRRPSRRSSAASARAFPPEPFRYLGASVIREAIVRREVDRGARRDGEPGAPRAHAAAPPPGLPPLAGLTAGSGSRPASRPAPAGLGPGGRSSRWGRL